MSVYVNPYGDRTYGGGVGGAAHAISPVAVRTYEIQLHLITYKHINTC
jgi:hypothetical protein